jgi:hypothetical protein
MTLLPPPSPPPPPVPAVPPKVGSFGSQSIGLFSRFAASIAFVIASLASE